MPTESEFNPPKITEISEEEVQKLIESGAIKPLNEEEE